jgi:hypothetical protein
VWAIIASEIGRCDAAGASASQPTADSVLGLALHDELENFECAEGFLVAVATRSASWLAT